MLSYRQQIGMRSHINIQIAGYFVFYSLSLTGPLWDYGPVLQQIPLSVTPNILFVTISPPLTQQLLAILSGIFVVNVIVVGSSTGGR